MIPHAVEVVTPRPGDRIADRYVVEELVGRGGYGTVFRCRDLLSDGVVALKWMERARGADAARLRREVAALRMLRLPGVVRLIDEGEDRGYRYLVMEYIDGAPFPGRQRRLTWSELAGPALALLEALGRIHDAGVVHRDLKPANVLVQPDGAVVVLDFGLVTGEPVGQSISGQGSILGTPGYLAPELVMGYRADARADLYACGVMFYEVLAGRRPVRADNALSLLRAAVFDEPEPLLSLDSSIPPEVARCIDRMVQANPAQRPASATEVSRLLGLRQTAGRDDVPWLGGEGLVDRIVDALQAGQAVTLAGGEGMGKTALVQRVAERLRDQSPLLLHHGKAPLSSLGELAPATTELAGLDLPAAMALAEQKTNAAVRQGRVLLIDDADRWDRWSSQVLERVAERGGCACLRTARVATGDAIVLEPLSAEDLAVLFQGPERLLHLPSTAARLLCDRTGGVPAQVRREVATWLRAGIASWQGEKLAVQHEQLARLRAQGLPLTVAPLPRDRRMPALGDTAPLGPTPRTSDVGLDLARDWLVGSQQADLLTWAHLAWPHATLPLLAQWLDQPLWRVQASLEELVDRGALMLHASGVVEPRWPAPGLGTWTADELSAAHRAIALGLPAGAERRLFHLVAGGCIAEVADEVLLLARRAWHDGRLVDAQGAVSEALLIVRREGHFQAENDLLVLLSKLALVELEPRGLERAIYEVGRAKHQGPLLTVCDRLLRLAIEVARN
ncbi:MAG: protein kinase, partial [Deltaproteobacteria bacterium]|nr:protein kinase [Deltaproteobacteria bacterium]